MAHIHVTLGCDANCLTIMYCGVCGIAYRFLSLKCSVVNNRVDGFVLKFGAFFYSHKVIQWMKNVSTPELNRNKKEQLNNFAGNSTCIDIQKKTNDMPVINELKYSKLNLLFPNSWNHCNHMFGALSVAYDCLQKIIVPSHAGDNL